MNVALRIAVRELRTGLSNFKIFLACLALGVAAIATVGAVRSAVQAGLTSEAATILGGDAEMTFTYRAASDEERTWMTHNAVGVSEVFDFRSMAVVRRETGDERALVQVKAIDDLYPIYGSLELEEEASGASVLRGSTSERPPIVVESVLADRLALEIGDTLFLGNNEFELSGLIAREPDSVGAGFSFGPRVILTSDALEGSGLITPGTLYETRYRLRLEPDTDLAALKTEAEALFRDTGLRWRDRRNGAPGLTRFIDRLSSFLVLVGLAGLIVGGVGVSAAVRTYLDKKTETIATLKTIGATGPTIFAIYFTQIAVLAGVGIILGLAIGTLIPVLLGPILAGLLPVPAIFGFYASPIIEAAIYGAFVSVIFTLWPLARAQDIKAAGLFRDIASPERALPKPVYILGTIVLSGALIGTAAWLSGIATLTLWSAAGVLAAFMVLFGAAAFTRFAASRLARTRWSRGRPSLRLALASIGGPGGETHSVVLSLGLGLSVLATIGQIDANMRNLISGELPEVAPAYFVVDIQNEQLPEFIELSRANSGVSQVETAAMLRGIVTRINGTPAREVAGEHWVLRGDRGVSYADTPPEGAEITEGTWWEPGYEGPPLVSFAAEEGAELGLKVGDEITVNILGRDIALKIANFRTVDFGTMGINFIMIVNEAALAGAPHSHIATIYAEQTAEAPLLRSIASQFPNITAIRTRDAIERVGAAFRAIASATSWGAGITLLTGFVVLIGAAAAGEKRRVFEAAVFKTLGATRFSILKSFALRSAIIGGAAGGVAMLAGTIGAWAVVTYVFDADFVWAPLSALLIVGGGALASLLAGLAFAFRPLSTSPSRILRAKE